MALNPFTPAPVQEAISNRSISWLAWFTAIYNILKYLNFGFGNPTFSAAKGSIYLRLDATTNTSRLWICTGGSNWVYVITSA